MKHAATELDLLALIEGELPPDRVEAVRAALTADPVLLRRVERMVRDRERLQREGKAAIPTSALAGLVAQAIAEAERDALLSPGSVGKPHAREADRHRRSHASSPQRRRAPMVIAAGVGIGVLGLVGIFILQSVGPEDVRRERPYITSKVPEGGTFAVATDPSMPEIVGPPAHFYDAEADAAEAEATIVALMAAREEAARIAAADRSMQPDDAPEASTGHRALVHPHGMSIDDAAMLARMGRLRLVVANADRQELSRSLNILASSTLPADAPEPLRFLDAAAANNAGNGAREPAAPAYTVRIGIDPDSHGDEQLREQLMAAVDRLVIVSGGDVQFQAVPEGASSRAHGPRPALTAANLLWWGQPPAAWQQRLELAIPVEPGH